MDKFALPLVVLLGIGAYFLVGEQFRKLREAPPPAQMNPVVIQTPQMPPFQPIKLEPFPTVNPFAKQAPSPEPAANDFTPISFDDPNKKFRVSFPGRKPTRVSFPIIKVVITRYTVPKPNMMFEIDEYDSGWDAAKRRGTARDWLTKCYKNQLEGMHASETTSKEIMFGEMIPGIEFEALYVKDEKTQVWIGRTYLVGSQLYSASVYGDPGIAAFRAPAFLDSFDLAPKATKPTPPQPTKGNID
ncbi:MAG: hypothetical protein K8U57_31715 [Planctomycetes bacterium]|nr:hypothetical protein [Planctomycetota bacterium]